MNYCHQNKAFTIWGLIFSLLLSFAVQAKSPAAGTLIQNQASATYKDANGVEQMATSNVVATLIQQVGAMELVQDQTRHGVVGNTVYLPHVLSNTGNGVDTYDLSIANVTTGDDYDFDLTKVFIYADANKDGLPDNATPISSTGALAADESFYFVIGAEIPASASKNQQGQLTVKGTSTFVETPTDLVVEKTNTDTVIVSEDAVINVIKSMSANAGASPSGTYTITLKYINTGVVTATNVQVTDILPAGMTYSATSGRWSETGSDVLTDADIADAQGTAPTVISYCAYTADCTDRVSFTIAEVAAGASGEVTFAVNIDSGLNASNLLNIAEFSYNNGTSNIPASQTNQVPFEVIQQLGVVANGSTSLNNSDADNLGGTKDAFIVATASKGATVSFDNIIRNTGNADDTFDITIDEASSTYPTGTVFQLFQSDGFTPLMDSNNNGIVDTGIMAVGASYKVVLKAVLPSDASGNNGGAGFKVTKTATSVSDSNISDTVSDVLNEITSDSVDLTNNSAGGNAAGAGSGPEASAVTTKTINAGEQAIFSLFINNTSNISNSYQLQYSKDTPFAPNSIEAGWSVKFHLDGGNGDCTTLGQAITTTSNISAGANQQVCAVVTSPANAVADNVEHPIYFRVLSALTGATDTKYDAVMIAEQAALSIAIDQSGQVEPGGSIVYPHRITNNGNTALECINVTSVDLDPQSGWSSVIYKDVNEDGQLDGGDTPLVDQTLAAGESFPILIKLLPPANAAMGLKNIQTLSVTGYKDDGDGDPATCTGEVLTDKVKDITNVNTSKVSLLKEQAVDAECDGAADTEFSATSFQVQPGNCIIYRLTATNKGSVSVKNARIDDASPTFTTFLGGAVVSMSTGGDAGNITGGEAGTEGVISAGSVDGASITLLSGESMILTFAVKLD